MTSTCCPGPGRLPVRTARTVSKTAPAASTRRTIYNGAATTVTTDKKKPRRTASNSAHTMLFRTTFGRCRRTRSPVFDCDDERDTPSDRNHTLRTHETRGLYTQSSPHRPTTLGACLSIANTCFQLASSPKDPFSVNVGTADRHKWTPLGAFIDRSLCLPVRP